MPRFHPQSLAFRFGLASVFTSALTLLIAGMIMALLQARFAENQLDRRLEVMANLLASAYATDTLEKTSLGEPLFQTPGSGWYWIFKQADGAAIASSASLFDPLPAFSALSFDDNNQRAISVETKNGTTLRMFEKRIRYQSKVYTILVTANASALQDDIKRFRLLLLLTLAFALIALVALSFIQLRFSLEPLKKLRTALSSLRLGQAKTIQGAYPSEIKPLVDDLNAMIAINETLLTRARHHVGNLAHSLKTPLSILKNEADTAEPTKRSSILESVQIMQSAVDVYLKRARRGQSLQSAYQSTNVYLSLQDLTRVMQTLYRDKNLDIVIEAPKDLRFQGEQEDFQEMAGNLIDNACKHAKSKVVIKIEDMDNSLSKIFKLRS